jgi:hypothetical protein
MGSDLSLRHAELKAGRALEHPDNLKRELQEYCDANPCSVTLYSKPEIGRRFLRVDLRDPSDGVYLLVGDFAHNLRSVLDHIVYSLVVKTTGELPDSRAIQWPVLTIADQKTFARQTKGLPDEAALFIESLQPYHAGSGTEFKRHPIWQLHRLDIVDKHHRVAINEIRLNTSFPTLSQSSDFTTKVGEGYLELSFPIDAPSVPMHFNPKPEIRFGASEEDLFLTIERLEEIYRFVSLDVLPRFAKFLRQSAVG